MTDDFPLADKRAIFLTCGGFKPLSEVASAFWMPRSAGGRVARGHDPADIRQFISTLGLHSDVEELPYATGAVVTRSAELLDRYEKAVSHTDFGRLFGYPDTAISAYADGDLLPVAEEDELLRREGIPVDMPLFRLSRSHHADEIGVLRKWRDYFERYSL